MKRNRNDIRIDVYASLGMYSAMELIKIYECLCDQTRLRILNLLNSGPLCVCHFQEVLDETQVKISKHLAYLKAREMVVATREANWMVYRLPQKASKELRANLACLQDCAKENELFRRDNLRLNRLQSKFAKEDQQGCVPHTVITKIKQK